MSNVYPIPLDTEATYRLPSAPPAQAGADIVVIADAEGQGPTFDPETGMTVIEADDGNVEVSVGPPAPDKKDSDFGDNLAEHLAETDLSSIAEKLMTGIEADDQSRSEWLQNAASSLSLLGLEVKSNTASGAVASTTPAEGTSQVDHPLLLEAVLRFQANALGELLPTDGPVKVRNDGEGTAANAALADALQKDLNHYLTKTAKEYYPDTDRMLLLLGFCGISFKKGYHDPIKRRPVIASIDAKDLIVSNTSTDLDGAGRVTHRIMMRPSVLKRMQMVGAYRDIDLPVAPTLALKNPVDEKIDQIQGVQPIGLSAEAIDQDRELYECYCEIDIPGFEHRDDDEATTGLPLPYKVVIDKEARKILEIRRNWDEDDALCMPTNRIIAYIFIPGIGFYGIGLLNVLGNATKAITAAWRLMLDSGMFSNFPGFLYLKQFGKQLTNQFRIPPGGGMPIDAAGLNDIRAAIMPLPYKDPSAVFIQLIDNIAGMARQVGGTAEAMIGEGKQDAPVGTTLALIEQATKIMSAVHKRLHQAQGQEFVMLKELLMEDPEALWRHNKKSKVLEVMKQQNGLAPIKGEEDAETERHKQMILAALGDMELIPMADPNTSSQTERYLKVMALRQMAMTNPSMDLNAVDQRALRTMGVDDADSLFRQADPNAQGQGPAPEQLMAMASQMAAYARLLDAQTKAKDAATKAATAAQDSINKDKELASKEHIARLNVARELVIHGSDQETAQRELVATAADKAQDRAHQTHLAALGHVADMHNAGQDRAHEAGLQNVVQQHQTIRDAVSHARQVALKTPQGVAPATPQT